MKSALSVQLNTTPAQAQRLVELQHAFAAVCNVLGPLVQKTRCWNRVALHHMAYKQLRQQFPELGSQMVCNAIYSVSRSCRIVYQHPHSPFNLARRGEQPIPTLHFLPQSPVYFDRHTLSIKDGQVSMYTLDGRMRFQLDLSAENEQRFREEKLREIVLTGQGTNFQLSFCFAGSEDPDESDGSDPRSGSAELPEYVVVTDDELPAALHTMPPQDNARVTP